MAWLFPYLDINSHIVNHIILTTKILNARGVDTKMNNGVIWEYPIMWYDSERGLWINIRSKALDKKRKIDFEAWLSESVKEGDYYLLLYSFREERFYVVCVSGDPDTRSLYRLRRRLLHNSEKFEYFITLTFPDQSSGKYPNGIRFENKKTLSEIRFHFTFSGYMRKFWNKLQQNRRNHNIRYPDECKQELMNYFWKYEEGENTGRPHVHAFIGNLEPKYPFIDNFRPVFKNINGKTWLVDGYIPPVPIKLHDELMKCWDSGFIQISPINSSGVKQYAGKYFSKKGSCNYRDRSRRWGTSRSISGVPKDPDILFIEKSSNIEYLYELTDTIDPMSYAPYGTLPGSLDEEIIGSSPITVSEEKL